MIKAIAFCKEEHSRRPASHGLLSTNLVKSGMCSGRVSRLPCKVTKICVEGLQGVHIHGLLKMEAWPTPIHNLPREATTKATPYVTQGKD